MSDSEHAHELRDEVFDRARREKEQRRSAEVRRLKQRIAELERERKEAFLKGVVEGMTRYAWWADGTQWVGTCGTTLRDAVTKAREEFAARAAGEER